MPRFLILKLHGPMQAWGTHTYEDFRPSNLFPTRSGLLGLLGACLGIDRKDHAGLDTLGLSLEFTVKVIGRGIRLSDYHTVLDARRANRKPRKGETVQTRREYLFDASFLVAIGERPGAFLQLDTITDAVQNPVFTPCLGRRSCPLSAPLFVAIKEAVNGEEALSEFSGEGAIYTEQQLHGSSQCLMIRDVPITGKKRSFGTRMVYIRSEQKGVRDVSEPG